MTSTAEGVGCLIDSIHIYNYCVANIFRAPLDTQAAWAQTIGSIAAIIAAFIIGNNQVVAARKERLELKISRLIDISILVQSCADSFMTTVSDIEDPSIPLPQVSACRTDEFRLLEIAVGDIKMFDINDLVISRKIMRLRLMLRSAVSICVSLGGLQRDPNEDNSILASHKKKLTEYREFSYKLSNEVSNLSKSSSPH